MTFQLSCSKCHQLLNLPETDKVVCTGCKTEFRRLGKAWDFRVLDNEKENAEWDADVFDASYEDVVEGCEDGYTHAAKQGIPAFLSSRMSVRPFSVWLRPVQT